MSQYASSRRPCAPDGPLRVLDGASTSTRPVWYASATAWTRGPRDTEFDVPRAGKSSAQQVVTSPGG